MFNGLKILLIGSAMILGLSACGAEKTAGTVTDTGNTVATNSQVSGVVLREDGSPAVLAKVRMAKTFVDDSILHVPNLIEVMADSEGVYSFDSVLSDTFQLAVIDSAAVEVFFLPRTTLGAKAFDSIQLSKAAVLSSALFYKEMDNPAVQVGDHFITCLQGTPFCQSVFASDSSFSMIIPEGSWDLEYFPGDPQIVAKLLEQGVGDSLIYRVWSSDWTAVGGDSIEIGPFVWSTTIEVDSLIKESERDFMNMGRLSGTVLCKSGNSCADVEVMAIVDIYGFDFVEGDSLEFEIQTVTDSSGRWWLPIPDSLPSDSFRVEFRKRQDDMVTQTGVSRYISKAEIENRKDTLDIGEVRLLKPSALLSGVSLVIDTDDSTQSSNCMVNSVVVGIKGTSHFVRDVTCNMLSLMDLPTGDQQLVMYSGDTKVVSTLQKSGVPKEQYVTEIEISLPEFSTLQQQWMTYTPPSQNIFE